VTTRVFLPFDLVDVFAVRPLEGNLLAVVHNADGVGDGVMQRLATRFRLSETSFVQAATDPAADYRHRIFTIAQEIPFAGHPSVGTAAVVVRRRNGEPGGECGRPRHATVVQQTGEGLQRLDVELDGDRARVALEQSPATFGVEIPSASLMAGFGLAPDDARSEMPPRFVSTGLPTLVIPLRNPAALGRISVDWPAVESAVGRNADVSFLNLYLVAEKAPGAWSARCFGQDIAGGEDPATGSAAGPLGSYIQATIGGDRFEIDQGVEMGEPSHISVSVRDGRPTVAGDVQFLGSGTIELPIDRAD
jgi:trans-2,3-dihydro-3-hydroxyanthranilate isomerase